VTVGADGRADGPGSVQAGGAGGARGPGPREQQACDACIARSWLLARLAGHLELARGRIELTLSLGDQELIAAVGGKHRGSVLRELSLLDIGQRRAHCAGAGVEMICRCSPAYPKRLLSLASPPAVLHVAGGSGRFLELVAGEPVAIVGSRKASPYGLEVARSLGRGLGCAGLTVVSGMALGVDSGAHAGALAADGPTVAVLPCGPDRPYPAAKRSLHAQIRTHGAAVSELPPGSGPWRWTFPARNRIIAGLSTMTVVVEACERSGALLTAAVASRLGRSVGAVPGRITSPLSAGPNALLAAGAAVVRGAEDVLETLFGAGAPPVPRDDRGQLAPALKLLLNAIGDGHDTPAALARAGLAAQDGLAALASLELGGYVRREPGGRFSVMP
jgi:DNA processing protein